jgi:hypothetical protein
MLAGALVSLLCLLLLLWAQPVVPLTGATTAQLSDMLQDSQHPALVLLLSAAGGPEQAEQVGSGRLLPGCMLLGCC